MARSDESSLTSGAPFGSATSASIVDDSPGLLDETHAATVDGGGPVQPDRPVEVAAGETIGRYVVLERLGAGTMGVVHLARDPELDRKVALKVLRPRADLERIEIGQRKLLAEAQALARLSDPNVVAVYDVGTSGSGVFVAMELVEGETLRTWVRGETRSWTEVLAALMQAARGLAAVHAASLVHRDIKPDNIMIGRDGRVRVMDFGLARAASTRRLEDGGDLYASGPLPIGAFVGTPSYCAPEQLLGRRVTPQADQFSLCVTAWEMLFGRRPFVADSVPGLIGLMTAGSIAEPEDRRGTPRWLRAVLRRGLSPMPDDRWPSITALLDALGRRQRRARLTRAGIGAAAVAAIAGSGIAWSRVDAYRATQACDDEGAAVARSWTRERSTAIAEAIVAAGIPDADAVVAHVLPRLEAHVDQLRAAHVERCRLATVDRTWDASKAERSAWCLDARVGELDVLLDALEEAKPQVVNRAFEALSVLPPAASCLDDRSLVWLVTPPPELSAPVREIRVMIARARVHRELGEYDKALPLGDEALRSAVEIGWLPLVAKARIEAAMTRDDTDVASTEAELERAYFEASRAGADLIAADAALLLVTFVGDRAGRPADGLRWANHVEVSLARFDLASPANATTSAILGDGAAAPGMLAHARASVYHSMGRLAESRELYQQAIAERAAVFGIDHLITATSRAEYGALLSDSGDHAAALVENEAVLAVNEAIFGRNHPKIAASLTNLARDQRMVGLVPEAIANYERAIAIWEASSDAEHPHAAQAINNLANAVATTGDLDRAWALHQRALGIRERVLGPSNPAVAQSLSNLATTATRRGDHASSLPLAERALAIVEKALGPDHPRVAHALAAVGGARDGKGDLVGAEQALRRALAILEKAGTVQGPDAAEIRIRLGVALAHAGKIADAREQLAAAEPSLPDGSPTHEALRLARKVVEDAAVGGPTGGAPTTANPPPR